jgi:hypothetical protein
MKSGQGSSNVQEVTMEVCAAVTAAARVPSNLVSLTSANNPDLQAYVSMLSTPHSCQAVRNP